VLWERDGMSEYDIRPVADDERRAVIDTFRAALLSGPASDELVERSAGSWDGTDALAAWDGERCVGHVGAFRFDSTIPGGTHVATAGVTRVGVLPTHTRRGLLTRLIHRLLHECRDQGNVLATLHASETPIYRRFGFGLGTDHVVAEITTHLAKPWRVPPTPGSMRLLSHGEVLDVVPPIYDRCGRWRVGSISRPAWWWARTLHDAAEASSTSFGKGSFVAVHTGADGVDDGFVHYSVSWSDEPAVNPTGHGTIHDLWGADPAVELALWRYLLDIDLVTRWIAELRPVDDAVRRVMHDARAYRTIARMDDQWVRILDLDAAMAARPYGSGPAVTVRVHDPMFERGSGTWSVSEDGARRTDASPDVEVGIAVMSAAYLGAVAWQELAAGGLVAAEARTISRLDALFAVRPAAFCGTGY
jgi:predicted acetyltransferase